MTALIGGHVDADCCTSSLGQVQAGAARILAVAEEERSEFLPEVMTFKECGYPVILPGYSGLMVPKKTPQRIVDILDRAMQEVLKKYGKEIQEGMLNRVEMAFRLYDPCFGCATHALPGQMPLEIRILNAKGEIQEVHRRNLD